MAQDKEYVEGVCPECGADLTAMDPNQIIGHANYHWNPDTPYTHWSEAAWSRRQHVMEHGGHKLPSFHSRSG